MRRFGRLGPVVFILVLLTLTGVFPSKSNLSRGRKEGKKSSGYTQPFFSLFTPAT